MIKNYLRSAFRNVKRQPFISFVNIFGLTVGLTCCLLIVAYVVNERSYDRFNKNANEIYRVTRIFYTNQHVENLHLSSVAPPFGPLLKTAFPDIKEYTRVLPNGTTTMRYGDKLFNEENMFVADERFFDFFTDKVLEGDPHQSLTNPYSVMLTPEVAHKYFGDADPINKSIILDNSKHACTVTGIFKPFPANSHLHPEILLSFSTLKDPAVYGEKQLETNFGNNAFYTYLLLPKNYDANRIESKLPAFLDEYVHLPGMPGNIKTHQATTLTLQKLTDIHLHSNLADEIEQNGSITRVYVFSAIALFILLIACINYMNLSTARSALRAKEIGIRKVIGARRKEIISQFLSESVLITWFSMLLAFAISALVMPLVNKISGEHLSVSVLLQWQILIPLIALPFIVGILSGVYPALFMSSFIPVKVLKGMFKAGSGGISFRKVLVVVQFSVSIVLIVGTIVVYRQLQYMQDKDLGFNKDFVLTMLYPRSMNSQFDAFKSDAMRNSSVEDMGRSSRIPSGRLLDENGAQVMQNGSMQQVKIDLKYLTTDYGFIPTYGMQLVAGRNFSKEYPTDTANYIINETAVKQLGWGTADKAIGKDLSYGGTMGKVIGVVKDFHFESLHQKITPLLFSLPAGQYYNSLSVKIDGRHVQSAINTLRHDWQQYQPDIPFDFSFLDQRFNQLYQSEQQLSSLVTIFSFIAIFIACLGLFGLSAFTISQRVKEIGVRKVLGASVPQIVVELSKDFLALVLVAAFIALPCSWFFANKWLADFASRIIISWWILTVAGIAAVVIAFATISFQSIKAANANPVKSLRSE